jgi:transposase
MADIQVIKHLHFSKRWSKRRIARELGISRRTVSRALTSESTGRYQMKAPRARPVTGAIEPVIRQLLKEEQARDTPRKQRLTAARIEKILRGENDFTGGEASVRRAVARVHASMGDVLTKAMVPLVYAPGVDGQVDFLEGDVDYPDGRRRCYFLLVRACYSTKPYAYHTPTENQEALLEGLEGSFQHFGGVFHHLWLDNLTAAVRKVLRSRAREVQTRFASFQAHYGFEAEFCGVGKANEKGGVENGVGYFRRSALSPVPEVTGDDDLAAHLSAWMAEEDARTPARRQAAIGQLWAEETAELMPLPATPFADWPAATPKVSAYSLVQDGCNFYSVPVSYVGQRVILKRHARTVELFGDDGPIAVHQRRYGRGEVSFELAHYLPLLERKARAFDRAAPVVAARANWPESYPLLLRVLRSREGEAAGTRAFIGVLELHADHNEADVHTAVRRALTHVTPSLTVVRAYLDNLERANSPREVLTPGSASAPPVTVAPPDVTAYDQLRSQEDHR